MSEIVFPTYDEIKTKKYCGQIYMLFNKEFKGCYIGCTILKNLSGRLSGHGRDYQRFLKGAKPGMTSEIFFTEGTPVVTKSQSIVGKFYA